MNTSKPHPPRMYSREEVKRIIKRQTCRIQKRLEAAEKRIAEYEDLLLGVRQEFHRGMSSLKKVDEKLP